MAKSLTLAISKNAKILMIFAVICTAIVGLVHLLTKEKIAEQQQQQLLDQLNSIIKVDTYNNDIYQDCLLLPNEEANSRDSQRVYRARFNGNAIAAAISTVAPDGYNGNIELLIAVNIDGTVSGVRTLKHSETPGLGDKIELRKSDWINSFMGKKLSDANDPRWQVNKDGGMFDQFTGATITPRAVVGAVRKTLVNFSIDKQKLFTAASNCESSNTSTTNVQVSSGKQPL